jgi:hypothetical protein
MNKATQSGIHGLDRSEYNQFIIDHVIDQTGDKYQTKCENCGNAAIQHTFEACHTGSVNQHYTLNCNHCGYHRCNQDVCSRCEDYYLSTEQEYGKVINHSLRLYGLVDRALENLNADENEVFTAIKEMLYQDEYEIDFDLFYFTDELTYRFNFMSYLLLEIMDRRFDIWLEELDKTF